MTDLLPLVKKFRVYVTHLAKSAEEEQQARGAMYEIYLQDSGMDIMCRDLRTRINYLNGKAHGLYEILGELNYILALAEESQEEKKQEKMTPENHAQTELQTLTKQLNALYELIYAQKQHTQTGATVADKQEKYAESVGDLIGEEYAQIKRTRRVQEEITLSNVLSKLKRISAINPDTN